MTQVEKHPMRQQIIDGILAGESLAKIARTVQPPVHHSSLSRYRMTLLGNATSKIVGRSDVSKALSALGSSVGSPDERSHVQAKLRQELHNRVNAAVERRERYRANAEELDEAGRMEHRALAAHDRNDLSALELQARLAGLLTDPSVQVNVQSVQVSLPAAPAESEPQVIDVAAG